MCREVLARASVLQTLVSVPNGFHGFELIQGAYKVTRWDMDETELKLASLVLCYDQLTEGLFNFLLLNEVQRRATPKNVHTIVQLQYFHNASKVMLKILLARLQQYMN